MVFDPGSIFRATVDPLDSDYLDYFPLKNGIVPVSSVKTTKLSMLKGEQNKFFQFGPDAKCFLENKRRVREILPRSEFYMNDLVQRNLKPIIHFLIDTFRSEHPDVFEMKHDLYGSHLINKITGGSVSWARDADLAPNATMYVDIFDALASQVVEDMAVITYDPQTGKDRASVLHLCAPSDWNVSWAFGKSFGEIHENVLKGNRKPVIVNPQGLVKGIIKSGEPVQRVGSVSFRPTNLVNRNLSYCPPDIWTWKDNQRAFMRFERQVVVPFPEINSFLLIIRSYYNDLLDPRRLPVALKALDNLSPDVYHKVFFNNEAENLKAFLQKNASMV